MTSHAYPPDQQAPRLGYLLKHVKLQFTELTEAALAPLGISTREWATLICLDNRRPLAQAEVARLVGIDRTTMVAVVDELQEKGLVQRVPDRDDRRKNVVEVTAAGRSIRQRAVRRIDDAERRFLGALSEPVAKQLKGALQALIDARSEPTQR